MRRPQRARAGLARVGGAAALLVAVAVLAAVSMLSSGRQGGAATPPDGGRIAGTVVEAVDGDTIRVESEGRVFAVRLLGIDAPETRRPGTPVECGGPEASAHLAALTGGEGAGRAVVLTTDPTQDRVDRYGRLLAYAELPGGELLQTAQLRAGSAAVYVYRGRPVRRIAELRREESAARAARRGVWGRCGGDFHGVAAGSAP